MRVLMDVDGVLADFVGAFLAELAKYGVDRTQDEVTEWDIVKALKIDQALGDLVLDAMAAPDYAYFGIASYPGSVALATALDAAHELYFVTSPLRRKVGGRHLCWASDREKWLVEMGMFDAHRIVHASAKHLLRGDVLIEDNPDNAECWLDANPDGQVLLVDRPWNRAYEEQHPIVRGTLQEHVEMLVAAND